MRRFIVGMVLAMSFSPCLAWAKTPAKRPQEKLVEVQRPPEPTAEELRQTIRDYIQNLQQRLGSFTIPDSKEKGLLRTLTLIRVHERVGKTGDRYYSCTDMKDELTGDQLDLDFDVYNTGEELKVVAVRIHKDNGKPRYTYDANDNLVPLS